MKKGVLLKIADPSAGIESVDGSNAGPSNWRCKVGLHDWSRWEQYERELNVYPRFYAGVSDPLPRRAWEEWEKRDCLRCGARHRRIVRGEVRI